MIIMLTYRGNLEYLKIPDEMFASMKADHAIGTTRTYEIDGTMRTIDWREKGFGQILGHEAAGYPYGNTDEGYDRWCEERYENWLATEAQRQVAGA